MIKKHLGCYFENYVIIKKIQSKSNNYAIIKKIMNKFLLFSFILFVILITRQH